MLKAIAEVPLSTHRAAREAEFSGIGETEVRRSNALLKKGAKEHALWLLAEAAVQGHAQAQTQLAEHTEARWRLLLGCG